ncbi:MAG: type IV toxin-antitoxin system AbiEi family antitoxin domain-containing protein [Planctomycetes bacterium]|nr:type IV toxin-antitoxin system AbiEi family antitoxin domain-containing protein [Planctomycetota bacterium]
MTAPEIAKDKGFTGRVREVASTGVMFRAGDIEVPSAVLGRLVASGELRRVDRGVYVGAGVELHPLWKAAGFCLRFPRAVVCLLTALDYYDLTTVSADGTWVMMPRRQNSPRARRSQLHVLRVQQKFLDPALGIDELSVHGVSVSITSPVRTVVDCWRYSRRVPFGTAYDALKGLKAAPHWNGRELFRLARSLGVWRKMRPYVEALS